MKKKIKKFKNIYIWIISFVFAILLWFSTILNKRYDYKISVPIIYSNLPKELIFSKKPQVYADIFIQDIGRNILKMIISKDIYKISIKIDLSKLRFGKNIVVFTQKNIIAPSTVFKSIRVDKNSLSLYVSPKSSKIVEINNNLNLKVKMGYIFVGEPKIIPNKVELIGPVDNLKLIKKVDLDLSNFQSIDDTIKEKVAIKIPKYYNVRLDKDSVFLQLFCQKIETKVITDIPVNIINVPKKLKNRIAIVPNRVTIEVEGGKDVLHNMSIKDFNVFLNFANVDDLNQDYPAVVNIFKNVDSFKTFPKKFKIILKEP